MFRDLGRLLAVEGRSLDALHAALRVGARVTWQAPAGAGPAGRRERGGVRPDRGDGLLVHGRARRRLLGRVRRGQGRAGARKGRRDDPATAAPARHAHLAPVPAGHGDRRPGRGGRLAAAPPGGRRGARPPGGQRLRAAAARRARRPDPPRPLPAHPRPGRPRAATAAGGHAPRLAGPRLRADGRRRARRAAGGRERVAALGGPGACPRQARPGRPDADGIVWCEDHLPTLVLLADADLAATLSREALAPLRRLRPDQADRLAQTLLAWLESADDANAAARRLHVHPQTIRYRLRQVSELFGDALADPDDALPAAARPAGPAPPGLE